AHLERRPRALLDGQHLRLSAGSRRPFELPQLVGALSKILAPYGRCAARARSDVTATRLGGRSRGVVGGRNAGGALAQGRWVALCRRAGRTVRRRSGAGVSMTPLPARRWSDDPILRRDLVLFHVYRLLSTSYLFLPVLVKFFQARHLAFTEI